MAATVASPANELREPQTMGQFKVAIKRITGDASSYAAGGYPLTAAQFGLTKIIEMTVQPTSGYVPTWVGGTGKLIVRWTGAGTAAVLAEVTNATDLSAVSFLAIAYGF